MGILSSGFETQQASAMLQATAYDIPVGEVAGVFEGRSLRVITARITAKLLLICANGASPLRTLNGAV